MFHAFQTMTTTMNWPVGEREPLLYIWPLGGEDEFPWMTEKASNNLSMEDERCLRVISRPRRSPMTYRTSMTLWQRMDRARTPPGNVMVGDVTSLITGSRESITIVSWRRKQVQMKQEDVINIPWPFTTVLNMCIISQRVIYLFLP